MYWETLSRQHTEAPNEGAPSCAQARYREGHDFLHVLTALEPTVAGELALKVRKALRRPRSCANFSLL